MTREFYRNPEQWIEEEQEPHKFASIMVDNRMWYFESLGINVGEPNDFFENVIKILKNLSVIRRLPFLEKAMSDLEKIEKMLENAGYSKEDPDNDPQDLGHKEYIVMATAQGLILAMGPGRIGDPGTVVNLNFDLSGKFNEHSCYNEQDED